MLIYYILFFKQQMQNIKKWFIKTPHTFKKINILKSFKNLIVFIIIVIKFKKIYLLNKVLPLNEQLSLAIKYV